MFTAIATIALLIFGSLFWWWFVARNRPAYPPLSIADDDPLLEEAKRQARASLPRFLELVTRSPQAGRVKIPFQTSAGETEFLWAEVLRLDNQMAEVRYLTPPISHRGRLERVHTHALTDIVDWIVTLPNGNYAGGFTMRVMFERGREQWEPSPPELAAEETKYV